MFIAMESYITHEETDEDEDSDVDESGYINITDEDVAYAVSQEAKSIAIIMMQKDLIEYITKMGENASFKGWIAHICPENVAVDVRLEMPGSAWHALWDIERKICKIPLKNPQTCQSPTRDSQIRNQTPLFNRITRNTKIKQTSSTRKSILISNKSLTQIR
jgi:hypothetical protein